MRRTDQAPAESTAPWDDRVDPEMALSPFKAQEWQLLTPAERLLRAWALRERLVNPQEVHDCKLFPAP
jgi:hypothetical protein